MLLWCPFLRGAEEVEALFAKGVTADLRNPELCDGVLTTEEGGVVTATDMRLQAKRVKYTRRVVEGQPVMSIEAEGDLLLEFGSYVFLGERLEFDFQTHTGVLYNGRTAIEPWFFGGRIVHLLKDGNYWIEGAYLTTSENQNPEWQVRAESALLTDKQYLEAKRVKFQIQRVPILWLPSFKVNLDYIFDSPIRYTARWGGRRTRIGLEYELFSWRRHKAFLILDYSFKRGFGAGFTTSYRSEDHREELNTINYFGRLPSYVHPNEKVRYRLQGTYANSLQDDTLTVQGSWDKLSDLDMPSDYSDRALEIDYALRTQLHLRKETQDWVGNFFTRVRVNDFQTVKQELPSLQVRWLPNSLGESGIISDTLARTAYLDFLYAKRQHNHRHHDFNSTRFEIAQKFYRPLLLNYVTLTPAVGFVGIHYGNSPDHIERNVVLGQFALDVNTRVSRWTEHSKHVVVPYATYTYFTYPTAGPDKHYIFDIEDGWYRLNQLRFGVYQNLYTKKQGFLLRAISADIWCNAFLNTKTIPCRIPKIHGRLIYNPGLSIRHNIGVGWDIKRGSVAYFNYLLQWTVNQNFAIAAEYRHRYAYEWRKVDRSNYILESFHSSSELRHSPLSDRRDTLLVDFFYRFDPSWALQFECRRGWNRIHERGYFEWEVDLLGTVLSAWNVKLYYARRVDGPNFGINFSIGLSRPSAIIESPLPCFD